MDGLSAYFLLVISLVAVAAAIYGPAYLRAHSPDAGPARQAAQVLALNVFLGCMAFVCCAGDALTFLLCWEGMTLASYVLVVSDDRDGENARAGLLYMVMAHGGTALLLVAFLTLTERAGAFDFAALRAAAGEPRRHDTNDAVLPGARRASPPRPAWSRSTSGSLARTRRPRATSRR